MDRTADFRRLVGVGGPRDATAATPPPAPTCAFLLAAGNLRGRLIQLRLAHRCEGVQPKEIQGCRESMSKLEATSDNIEDLGPRTPLPQQSHDLLALRRGVVRDLYEELRDLASHVQTTQMQEMRRENQVASFFTAAAAGAPLPLHRKPPPAPAELSTGPADAALDEDVKAEARELEAAFETNLDQINSVKHKLGEVATMVSVFAMKAEEQQEVAAQVLEDAQAATTNVEEAGKQLKKANDNKSSYNFYIICWFLGASMFLLVFDFIDARYSWI